MVRTFGLVQFFRHFHLFRFSSTPEHSVDVLVSVCSAELIFLTSHRAIYSPFFFLNGPSVWVSAFQRTGRTQRELSIYTYPNFSIPNAPSWILNFWQWTVCWKRNWELERVSAPCCEPKLRKWAAKGNGIFRLCWGIFIALEPLNKDWNPWNQWFSITALEGCNLVRVFPSYQAKNCCGPSLIH